MMAVHKILHLFIIILLCCFRNAAAYEDDGFQPQGGKVADRVERLERDLTILQKQFYRGDVPAKSKSSGSSQAVSSSSLASVEAKVGNLEEEYRKLNGHIESLEHSIKQLNELISKNNLDIEFRFKELQTGGILATESHKAPQSPPKQQDPVVADAPKALGTISVSELDDDNKKEAVIEPAKPQVDEVQIEFDRAFALVKASKFAEVEKAFSSFVEQYPTHKLSGLAYYWLGDSFFVRKNYEKAAINFLRCYKKFPKSSKAPESLLKLATSLSHLNKKKDACAALGKLANEFNNMPSGLKQRAKEESARIGCK